ncbi:MAG: hypothetical protein ACREID_07610, partial [Planctomycetota bacterium]
LLVARPHGRAGDLLRAESAAVGRLRALVRERPAPPHEEGGYRFFWCEGEELPPLLVAAPVRPGETGVRSFASLDGVAIYERDPVTHRPPAPSPGEARLRRYLALSDAEKRDAEHPPDWRRLPG